MFASVESTKRTVKTPLSSTGPRLVTVAESVMLAPAVGGRWRGGNGERGPGTPPRADTGPGWGGGPFTAGGGPGARWAGAAPAVPARSAPAVATATAADAPSLLVSDDSVMTPVESA